MFRAASQSAKVIDYLERIDDRIVWGPIFRRNLNEVEAAQFREMMTLIGNIFVPNNGKDRRVFSTSTNGMFSVASLFLSMTREAMAGVTSTLGHSMEN